MLTDSLKKFFKHLLKSPQNNNNCEPDQAEIKQLRQELARETSRANALEDAQHNLLAKWRIVLNSLQDSVMILDRDMRVINANKTAIDLLHTDDHNVLGKRCYELLMERKEQCPDCPMTNVEQEQSSDIVTHRKLRGKYLRIYCSPMFQDGKLEGYLHCARDISMQHTLEKQLVHARKMEAIATLAGGIAHDFNNILTTIIGNVDLLRIRMSGSGQKKKSGQLSASDADKHLKAIKKAGNRAKDLVSQILTFSKQTTGKHAPLIIAPVVKEAVKLLRSSLPTTIELNLALGQDIGKISGDPAQIHQILMNLSTNAASALKNGHGTIDIGLHPVNITGTPPCPELEEGRYIKLSVTDNGIGMSQKLQERIFEPFFTTNEVGQGSGMGLAALHGIITAHKAVIDVQSELGKGTSFSIYFPELREEEQASADQVEKQPHQVDMTPETILCVDDEKEIVAMEAELLECLGYTTVSACNGEEALAYLKDHLHEVDLVITDQTMPGMSGLELAQKVQELRNDLPFFLCSGYTEVVTEQEAAEAGIVHFFAKPTEIKVLAEMAYQVFHGSKTTD